MLVKFFDQWMCTKLDRKKLESGVRSEIILREQESGFGKNHYLQVRLFLILKNSQKKSELEQY